MSESLGSVLVIRIFLVFLVLYILFIAVTFNFLKAYKSKNYIVEHIEKNNGSIVESDINAHLSDIGMLGKTQASGISNCSASSSAICLKKSGGNNYPYNIFMNKSGSDCYYGVEVYTTIKFLGLEKVMTIKGETKKVTNCS